LGKAIYFSANIAKVSKYSAHWGRLDSWWSVGRVGIFALVAIWVKDDEIVDAFGDWSAPWRKDQKLKRGFALGRAGDANGGLGAAARGLGHVVGVDTSDGIWGCEAASFARRRVYDASHSLMLCFSHRRGRCVLRPRQHHRRRRDQIAQAADAPGGDPGAARDVARRGARGGRLGPVVPPHAAQRAAAAAGTR